MVEATFLCPDGTAVQGRGAEDTTLMELAKSLGIAGIVAECGGACACATCQVVCDEHWFAVVGPPNENETEMLEMAASTSLTSRLSCQIRLAPELDGLVVSVPEEQG
jgi:ferredoxin, 2Fe-2S